MRVKKLELDNFRCFSHLEMNLDPHLSVLVGVNGAGKTAILEAMSVSLGTLFVALDDLPTMQIDESDVRLKAFQMGSKENFEGQYPVKISVSGEVDGQEGTWSRTLNKKNGRTTIKDAMFMRNISESCRMRIQNGDPNLVLPVLAYYGTGRLWDYHRAKKEAKFRGRSRTSGYIDCLDGRANIKLMMDWFRTMTETKNERLEIGDKRPVVELETVLGTIEECLRRVTGCPDVRIFYNYVSNSLIVHYVDQNGQPIRIPMNQMSDGYKGTLSLVADIAYRMASLNPQLGSDIVKETGGIVLIDEVDLHLHPGWQQRVLKDLTAIFPKVQFIVSTHAVSVINSVRSENLFILENNQVVQPENNQVYGKDVKSVMNEIMGVQDRPQEVSMLFDQFYQFLTEKRLDDAGKKLDEIDKIREYRDPELAKCRVALQLEKLRKGGE